jgi:hypothetical protein
VVLGLKRCTITILKFYVLKITIQVQEWNIKTDYGGEEMFGKTTEQMA